MSDEKFCLKWNDYEPNISAAFRDIREEKEFFDLTIACEDDKQISAHKVILSACSPFFRGVLKRNPHQHPLLYLKGVSYKDMSSVLSFMYHGEVNVAQDELNSFLQVAEDLRVKGLTQNNQSSSESKRKSESRVNPSIRRKSVESSPASTPKRFRPDPTTNPVVPIVEEEDDIQEVEQVIPVKVETGAAAIIPSPLVDSVGTIAMYSDAEMSEHVMIDDGTYDERYEEEYENEYTEEQNYLIQGGQDANTGSRALCTICQKLVHKSSLKRHIRTVHTENLAVQCLDCSKTFKNVESLITHQRTVHRTPVSRAKAFNDISSSDDQDFD